MSKGKLSGNKKEKRSFLGRRSRLWKRAAAVFGCAVAVGTTYALILPAITMENDTVCGLEAHTHTEECYRQTAEAERELTCTLESLGIHQHTAGCYDNAGNLTCTYADYVIHTHDDNCYDSAGNLVCTLPEITPHTHTDACYGEWQEIVIDEGHTHTASCYAEGTAPSSAPAGDYSEEDGDQVLVIDEDSSWDGSSGSSGGTLICGKEESPRITAEVQPDPSCGKQEIAVHTHTADCFVDGLCICGKLETLAHQHNEDCFTTTPAETELICGKQEHTHTDACYPDVTTELEKAGDAQKTSESSAEQAGEAAGEQETSESGTTQTGEAAGEQETLESGAAQPGETEAAETGIAINIEETEKAEASQPSETKPEDGSGIAEPEKSSEMLVTETETEKSPETTGTEKFSEESESEMETEATSEEPESELETEAASEESESELETEATSEESESETETEVTLEASESETETEEWSEESETELMTEEATEDMTEELLDEQDAASESANGVVIRAVVDEEGTSESNGRIRRLYAARANVPSAQAENPGEIKDHLTSAEILVNGEPYDGTSELNPGEQFAVKLEWNLNRTDLEGGKSWTYAFPAQIHVDNVEETVLYDETGIRKGVYSIQNGVLTVTYDNVSDKNTTTFELNATWNREQVDKEITVKWNDTLESTVHFNDAQIAVTKKNSEVVNQEDGGLVGIYQVGISAENAAGTVEGITLTDTLTSEKFTFCEDYFEDGGQKYDYRYTTDSGQTYTYGNFTVTSGEDNSKTFTLSGIRLEQGQEYILEYGVLLSADDRLELDTELKAAGLRNTATATYTAGGEEISSSVTVEDTYRADTKWVVKKKGNAEDATQKTDVPWIVTVNNDRNYAMSGAVIGDQIQTAGAVYKTGESITATMTTDTGSTKQTLTWISLSDTSVAAIQNAGGNNAIDVLFSEAGASVRAEIEAAVGGTVTKDNISNYVFVNQSKNQFVWFTPQTVTPTTYRLDYITDISNVESGTITNSASAGWKNWTVGVVEGSFYQEVKLDKKNDGVYQKNGDDGYYVNWTVTLTVPEGSNPIENVYLFDTLPIYTNFDYNGQKINASDWLMGLSGDSIDYNAYANNPRSCLDNLAKGAFTITTDAEREDVQSYVSGLSSTLGNPSRADGSFEHVIYGFDQTSLGQLAVTNGQDDYANARITPYTFGIDLGTLPGTKDGTGAYTITVKYTTRVSPARVEVLDGQDGATNYAKLLQKTGTSQDLTLADADAHYWVSKTNVNKALEKSVAAFNPQNDLLTYEVLINPDGTLDYGYCDYILHDVLDIPGAQFVEGSFRLVMLGEFDESYNITLDPKKETFLWPNSENTTIKGYFDDRVALQISNRDSGSSEFTLTLHPGSDNGYYLQKDGKLIPMKLTYQVKLPGDFSTTAGDQDTITNSVTMTAEPQDGPQVLIDGDKTTFDYTTALHKQLAVPPAGSNNYTAGFEILVDKTVDEWQEADSFTVSDTMSKSLAVDITTVQVMGIAADGTETALAANAYTVAYDDRSEVQNLLSVTVTDSEDYVGYRIVYSTHLIGAVGETVTFDNTAAIDGTSIQSEKVEEQVYIQTQGGNVTETNYEVRLVKYDASDTSKRLSATFDLYAYESGDWERRVSNLRTDTDGGLIINNTVYSNAGLAEDTWFKLVETSAPTGYLKGVTYFHIGTPSSGDKNPDGAAYTVIPLNGGTHQIPNYKAELRLHKVSDTKASLSGAEFALYSDTACTEKIADATESANGIYTFSLSGLTAGNNYYLKETKAPAGYKLPDTVYTVTFDAEGKVTLKDKDDATNTLSQEPAGAFPITNYPGYELPETGGPGTILYQFGGVLLTLGASLLLYDKYRKRKGVMREQ